MRVAISVAVLMLPAAGCRMPHLQQPVAAGESSPDETGGRTPAGEPPDTPAPPPVVVAPGLAIADVSAAESDGTLTFTVSLSPERGNPVTVAYTTQNGTATAGSDYRAASGTLTFPADSTAAQTIPVTLFDDRLAEPAETFTVRLNDPRGATLAVAAATGTIADDDQRAVAVQPAALNVTEGASGSYSVALSSQPTATVTIRVTAPPEIRVVPETLVLTRRDWASEKTVTVTAAQDEDAVANAPVELVHTVYGGDYDGTPAAAVRVTIVEDDTQSLAMAPARAPEGAGVLRFEVSLSLLSDAAVTVDYETGAARDTATAGTDYRGVSGTLTFPAHTSASRMIEVPVVDDAVDEPDELLTVTLSNPAHATLAGGGESAAASGIIKDDEPAPLVRIADASLDEGGGSMRFAVRLDRQSAWAVTVSYATADVTARAGADYTPASGTLTFPAGTTERTIDVPVLADGVAEDAEIFTVTLSAAGHAELAAPTATGTIADRSPLELESLQVIGGTMYPDFAAGIRHYAITCADATSLQVIARAPRTGARLTLLRAAPDDNHVSTTGSLDAEVTVHGYHDIAIELARHGATITYVVHCLPASFPRIRVLKQADDGADWLLFLTPTYDTYEGRTTFMAVVDYHGVPRFHRKLTMLAADSNILALNFRPQRGGRSSISRSPSIDWDDSVFGNWVVDLLDERFEVTGSVHTVSPLTHTDGHDFVITGAGNYLLPAYARATHDFSEFGSEYSTMQATRDSVIQEVTPGGERVFQWNSWDHRSVMQVGNDCTVGLFPDTYAHLNSLQHVHGDIVASFRGCAQVLRIDGETGAVKWKLGGSAPPEGSDTEYLEIVDDPAGEFCGQHHVTLTASGAIVMFDNGVECLGSRKLQSPFTRVVAYDVSSGTRAAYAGEFRLPDEHGYALYEGGVSVLGSGHWLISWGQRNPKSATVGVNDTIAVSEVLAGTARFHLHMSKGARAARSYRVYRKREADVRIPLNLP